MNAITVKDLTGAMNLTQPTTLYAANEHRIFWLGNTDETAFRCNTYLIVDHHEAILIDPGGKRHFAQVIRRVAQILPPEQVNGMVLCHQDPDVAASMTDWLAVNPSMRVFTTPRTQVLLPHYGRSDYWYCDVSSHPVYTMPSGARLNFIEAPFLHFPGAFVTYDAQARYLFSGDIWAALDLDWTLVVDSFEKHVPKMNLFHLDYMASNLAARGFVKRIEHLAIDAILPQHGSILGSQHVAAALDYLRQLHCGTDIIYADLENDHGG
ncbi:MBL fold metallo-hydrolase [Rhodoferax sp.]|uniref:MBL fold metallo-hydrolase n=1 Tax=Rhodoferax sp. TaxID=50421 RepID=UPI002633B395|nr:MBL fold metallo-hydrolase [Rhodoferax sp.]MDD2926611.1 MBL fold metallo-hydrolase [Rhodoferax sp.]